MQGQVSLILQLEPPNTTGKSVSLHVPVKYSQLEMRSAGMVLAMLKQKRDQTLAVYDLHHFAYSANLTLENYSHDIARYSHSY